MLKELINRVRGQVWLRVTCSYPERVLNLCSARKLAFWDLEWEGAETFTCRMSRGDHRILSRAAEKLDCTIEIVRREGAPYTLAKLRHRQALAVGIAACGTAVLIGSFFVWDIQIAGNETVPREVILRSLENNGVHRGCFGFALNGEDIRNHVLLEIPELSWVAVNVSGCRANVEVRERRTAPKPLDRKTPCNLVARRDGLVLRVQALGGVPQVMKGMSVTEGQLLISGVEDTETVGARVLTGMGKAEARTWYTLSTVMPLTVAEKQYTGEEKQGYSLVFGTNRVKFFLNSSIGTGNYDKITERTQWSLFGLPLPVTFVKETFRFYETVPAEVSAAQAESRGEAILTDYLHTLVDPYGTVSSTLCTSRREGDGLLVTLTAECVEEIGRAVPIYTDPTEESGG
ncbi:MAG: sporulation protein YqfD [Oscillibacter sp.]|nr:sporulation protein YqfD [Oscillibacter sp.]